MTDADDPSEPAADEPETGTTPAIRPAGDRSGEDRVDGSAGSPDADGDRSGDGANVERRWERAGGATLVAGVGMALVYAWLFVNGVRSPDPTGGFTVAVLVAFVGFAVLVGFRAGRTARWLADRV